MPVHFNTIPEALFEAVTAAPAGREESPRELSEAELDGAMLAAVTSPAPELGPGWRRLRSTGEPLYSARWL